MDHMKLVRGPSHCKVSNGQYHDRNSEENQANTTDRNIRVGSQHRLFFESRDL